MKEYTSESITVSFESKTCLHSGECIKGLPEVFDLKARPWINIDGASAERIKEQIDKCPSGALKYNLHKPVNEVSNVECIDVKLMKGGPYLMSGKIRIELDNGEVIEIDGKVALCRCGASSNKPFCDGTHKNLSNL